jgi:hypothetical protein
MAEKSFTLLTKAAAHNFFALAPQEELDALFRLGIATAPSQAGHLMAKKSPSRSAKVVLR